MLDNASEQLMNNLRMKRPNINNMQRRNAAKAKLLEMDVVLIINQTKSADG